MQNMLVTQQAQSRIDGGSGGSPRYTEVEVSALSAEFEVDKKLYDPIQ